jgi:addiction module HigA family antidote
MLPKNRPPSHPGEILLEEFLKPLGLSQVQFARHVGWTYARVNELINEKRGVTPETALVLADVFGTSPELWINLQKNYDLWHAARKHKRVALLIAS